ncbi:XdhC/CoxF family protein [Acuticoccus sediminis]|uniref:XdhC/CoxF family protein n=1 Tax=Acuticoccus sediminis TaxID=2184697 RepID=A0A8B2P093_9HYPH|nr:XdhC family protein [Acuticoccus sediminis]RAI03875.1 XdhC/CoxF family protein [Acuticoccus sediminis]
MRLSDLKAVNEARSRRRMCAVVTPLDGSPGRVVFAEDAATDPLANILAARFASAKSGREAEAGVFVRIHRPSPRLVIIGAVHVSQTLAPMAEAVGFEVTIVDPRGAFATEERFGAFNLIAEWPDEELLKLDRETAVTTLTHDPKIDDPALMAALKADCFYIGALGSRKTHAKRVDRMTAAGFGREAIDRIHAPIGLPIGAASPPEIAVSVLAEVIAALRGAETRVAPQRQAA